MAGALSTSNFYPRSPCGERPDTVRPLSGHTLISIHALLAESDWGIAEQEFSILRFLSTLSLRRATGPPCAGRCRRPDFYPRSPCGERLCFLIMVLDHDLISIHALLAESDHNLRDYAPDNHISIHALLAESDSPLPGAPLPRRISIHALLAESDEVRLFTAQTGMTDFYPRSPCGERRGSWAVLHPLWHISIHALLAESDPAIASPSVHQGDFYPRSPCGERRTSMRRSLSASRFLSTLSLRRATGTPGSGR